MGMQRGGASCHRFLLVVVLLWWLPTAVVRRVGSFSLLPSSPYPSSSLPTEDRLARCCRRDDDRRSPRCARLTSKDGWLPALYHCDRRCPVARLSSPSSLLFALRSSSSVAVDTAGKNKNNDTSILPAAPPPRPAGGNDDKTFKATIAAKKRQLEDRRNSITEASAGPSTATPATAYSSSSSLTDEALSSSLPSSSIATKDDDAAAADDFRDNLQSLAELCCDPREPVIAHAARCEETWRRALTGGPGAVAGHRASCFHAVLKAWNHCTQTLAEHRFDRIVGSTTMPGGSSSSGGGASSTTSIPVYTARDAAARATELLQEQCELYRRQQREHREEEHVQDRQQQHEQQHLSSFSGAGAGAGGAVPAAGAAVPPDVVSFTHCMEAWSKSRIEGAEERVQALMQQLQRDYGLRPDEYCYNAWLQALAASKQPDRLEQMHRIWKHMQQQEEKSPARPSIRTVNIVLHAYSRRIGELIRDTLNNGNNKIHNNNRGEEHRRVREQAMHLAQRAEKILVQQHRAFEETGLAAEEPNIATYTTVMDAYARIGTLEATERCQRIMERLQERTKHAVETTSSDRYLVQRYRPTAQTYTAMIDAWTNVANFHREAPERAQEVLDTLLERVEGGELPAAGALHGRVFTAAMHAWGRSPHHASKAAKCWLLLQQMLEWSKRYPGAVQPNTVSYHAAMESCAKPCPSMTPHQQTASLKLAFAMFRDMQLQQQRQQQQQSQQHSSSTAAASSSMIFPNHSTFNILLRAVYNCLPAGTKERDDIGRATFDKAIKAGQVDGNLVKMLQRTVTAPVFEELCRDCFPPSTATTTTTTTSSSSSRAHKKKRDQSSYQYKRQKPRVDYDRIPAAWSKHVRK